MILVIDNYDSFTYNLVQALGAQGAEMNVIRNNKLTLDEAKELEFDRMIISPGPCTPREAGVSCEFIRYFSDKMPILGVCLGHQSIGHAFGADVIRAELPVHGKTDEIKHDGNGIYKGLANPFTATRYHSLLVDINTLPDELEPVSYTVKENILMGIRHKKYPVEGVQFHPESFLTSEGDLLLKNFLEL